MEKKIFVYILIICRLHTVAQSTSTIVPGGGMPPAAPTDRTGTVPPENIQQSFEATFPKSTSVAWKVEGNNFRVNFTDPETKLEHVIVYDKEGNVIRREDETDKLTYPSRIAEYYSGKYPKESFRVWQTEREPGMINYFIIRKGKIIWFDQTGAFIPRENKAIK
jgi:hypothetical protein